MNDCGVTTNVIGITEADRWEHRGEDWLWCVWLQKQGGTRQLDTPSSFGFASTSKKAQEAAWKALREATGPGIRIQALYCNDWATHHLASNDIIRSTLDEYRDSVRELHERPSFSSVRVGKGKWFWIVSTRDGTLEGQFETPLAEGMADSTNAALQAAEKEVGPVVLRGSWLARGYRKWRLAKLRQEAATASTSAAASEFVYRCVGGFVEPHRIVKRTEKRLYVDVEPAYSGAKVDWRHYVPDTFILNREDFERTGKADQIRKWHGDTFYADPQLYFREKKLAQMPECLILLEFDDSEVNAVDVKRAYKRLAKIHHPDAGGDAEMFKKIRDAYEKALQLVETEQATVR